MAVTLGATPSEPKAAYPTPSWLGANSGAAPTDRRGKCLEGQAGAPAAPTGAGTGEPCSRGQATAEQSSERGWGGMVRNQGAGVGGGEKGVHTPRCVAGPGQAGNGLTPARRGRNGKKLECRVEPMGSQEQSGAPFEATPSLASHKNSASLKLSHCLKVTVTETTDVHCVSCRNRTCCFATLTRRSAAPVALAETFAASRNRRSLLW